MMVIRELKQQMKKTMLILTALAGLTIASQASPEWSNFAVPRPQAGDLFLIGGYNSLITARQSDLVMLMALNARGLRAAVRQYYRQLVAQGLVFNLQPGDRVMVVAYYPDATAEITWAGGAYHGFIAKDDLTVYLGGL